MYSRGDSQGYRSLDPQPKRIEEEDRTGCLCTHGDTLRALGLLTLDKENQREGQDRSTLYSQGDSHCFRSLSPKSKRIKEKDRTDRLWTSGLTLRT